MPTCCDLSPSFSSEWDSATVVACTGHIRLRAAALFGRNCKNMARLRQCFFLSKLLYRTWFALILGIDIACLSLACGDSQRIFAISVVSNEILRPEASKTGTLKVDVVVVPNIVSTYLCPRHSIRGLQVLRGGSEEPVVPNEVSMLRETYQL